MEDKQTQDLRLSFPLVLSGVLFAMAGVLLQNLLGPDPRSPLQEVSLCFLVSSLPCLAGFAGIIYQVRIYQVDPQVKGKGFLWLYALGVILAFTGIALDIFAASIIAGTVFSVFSIGAASLSFRTLIHISDLADQKREGQDAHPSSIP